jgi:predicted DNA-binding protein (MmcQ/YjbR family)
LQKKGVTECFPFDQDTLVFKVGEKMFRLASRSAWKQGKPSLNLKCDPEKAEDLRTSYNAVKPVYHMSKKHWNTIALHQDVPLTVLLELIGHSYDLVFKSLPKKVQATLD